MQLYESPFEMIAMEALQIGLDAGDGIVLVYDVFVQQVWLPQGLLAGTCQLFVPTLCADLLGMTFCACAPALYPPAL